METTDALFKYGEESTARSFGLTVATLRLYRTNAIVRPITFEGVSYYSEHDRLRIRILQKALRLGFTLEDVGKLIDGPPAGPDERLDTIELWHLYALEAVRRSANVVQASRNIFERRIIETSRMLDNMAHIRLAMKRHRELLSLLETRERRCEECSQSSRSV